MVNKIHQHAEINSPSFFISAQKRLVSNCEAWNITKSHAQAMACDMICGGIGAAYGLLQDRELEISEVAIALLITAPTVLAVEAYRTSKLASVSTVALRIGTILAGVSIGKIVYKGLESLQETIITQSLGIDHNTAFAEILRVMASGPLGSITTISGVIYGLALGILLESK